MGKEILISGKALTESQLYGEATKLANIAIRLDLVARTLENLQYQQKTGDEFAVAYFLRRDHLGLIYENIDLIRTDVQSISDGLCPDL